MNFNEFFEKFILFFALFGCMPYSCKGLKSKITLNILKCLWTCIALIAFGIGVVFALRRAYYNNKSDSVSQFSNILQLTVNGLALLVVLLNPIVRFTSFSSIIEKFEKIDEKLESIGTFINYKASLTKFFWSLSSFIMYMTLYICYSFYVAMIHQKLPAWY